MNHRQVIAVALAASGVTSVHVIVRAEDPERWRVHVIGRDAYAAQCSLAAVGYDVTPLLEGVPATGMQILELTLYGEEG